MWISSASNQFPPDLLPGEFHLAQVEHVKLDTNESASGVILLTSHRLFWHNKHNLLHIDLQNVLLVEMEAPKTFKSPKMVIRFLNDAITRLSFKDGGEKSFERRLHQALAQRQWEVEATRPMAAPKASSKQLRSGIAGIEKSMARKAKIADKQISKAFQDLDQLIEMAKPMVALANNISGKIRESKGDISDDETVQFKAYLLSLGIDDPVTRESHGSGSKYFRELAKEAFRILETPIRESGGLMTLTDAFCRVNRARGLELVSPEDLLNACKVFKQVHIPLRLHTFPKSGVVAIKSTDAGALDKIAKATEQALKDAETTGITADDLARSAGVSLVLAKERLLSAEDEGVACRDDSVQGLRFYPNLFLQRVK